MCPQKGGLAILRSINRCPIYVVIHVSVYVCVCVCVCVLLGAVLFFYSTTISLSCSHKNAHKKEFGRCEVQSLLLVNAVNEGKYRNGNSQQVQGMTRK